MKEDVRDCLNALLAREYTYDFRPAAKVNVESDGKNFANVSAMNHATGEERQWLDRTTAEMLYKALVEAHAFALGVSPETHNLLNLDDLCAEMDTFPIITDD